MYIDKMISETSIDDFNDITHLDKDTGIFSYKGESLTLFPAPSPKSNKMAMDQVILTGHYLYYQNEQFRRAYIETFGHEMQIAFKDMREIYLKNTLYVLFYGMVVAKYVENMKEVPMHYMHRLINDEPNPDKSIFLSEERKVNPRYKYDSKGSPFCGYIRKKSLIIRPPAYCGFEEGKGINIICPIKGIIPTMKQFMCNYHKFAELVFNKLNTLSEDDRLFTKIFFDSSWSAFLDSN